MPIGVLAHELGHFGAAVALGFREPRLHAFSTEYLPGGYPESARLIVTAAGFLMTAILTVGAAALAFRRPRSFLLALCLAAPARALVWVPIGILVAQGRATIAGGDEVNLARLMHVPLGLVIGYGLGLMGFAVLATLVALRRRDAAERSPVLLGLFLGLCLGWLAYGIAGPRLL